MCPCPCPPYFWHPFCFFAENTELGMGDEIGRRHQVRVTWDRPMTVRCGVASEAAPGGGRGTDGDELRVVSDSERENSKSGE